MNGLYLFRVKEKTKRKSSGGFPFVAGLLPQVFPVPELPFGVLPGAMRYHASLFFVISVRLPSVILPRLPMSFSLAVFRHYAPAATPEHQMQPSEKRAQKKPDLLPQFHEQHNGVDQRFAGPLQLGHNAV